MRLRPLGIAMLMFGLAGVLASCGGWWLMYRYSRSAGDIAGIRNACASHCGGVDGGFLVGAMVSGGVAVLGLAAAFARISARGAIADQTH